MADIIGNAKELNQYELIVYKYIFISELKIPLHEELGIEIAENSFILYIIPDDLKLSLLHKLDEAFDRFEAVFMPNQYGLVKLKFKMRD